MRMQEPSRESVIDGIASFIPVGCVELEMTHHLLRGGGFGPRHRVVRLCVATYPDSDTRGVAGAEPHFLSSRKERSRGEQPKELFRLADEDPAGMIQVQTEHRGSTHRRFPNEVIALPSKMHRPRVPARVEQGDELAAVGIEGLEPIGFVQVTGRATPGQIVQNRGSTP